MEATNAESFCMSPAESSASAPIRPVKATLNSLRSAFSPRQWKGSVPMMPCRVCVTIGPFIGCQAMQVCVRQSSSNACIAPAGFPRSHAKWSVRPSTWQDAQLAWPRPEVRCVS